MEQNKVLMIIVSVAIFFAAIVGVGVALLYPRADAVAAVGEAGLTDSFDPIEYVRRPETAPLQQTAVTDEPVIIVYGEREAPDADDADGATEQEERTITVAPARARPQQPESNTIVDTSPVESPVAAVTPAVTPESAETAQQSVSPAPAVSGQTLQSTRPEPRRIRVTEYWIQLIASPSRDRVEQVQGTLADYSIGGRVTTRDVDGELYYRLRVGPYDNHDEAEKFLAWIRDIEGFEGAYISEEYPLRTVNG